MGLRVKLIFGIFMMLFLIAGCTETNATPTNSVVTEADTPTAVISDATESSEVATATRVPLRVETPTPLPEVTVAPPPEPTPELAFPQPIVASGSVAVRSGPNDNFRELGTFADGESFELIWTSALSGWWQVCCIAGESGWIGPDIVADHIIFEDGPVLADSTPISLAASDATPAVTAVATAITAEPATTPVTNDSTPTPEPAATEDATPEATPEPTAEATPEPTTAPTRTAPADGPTVSINANNVNIHSGPGTLYEVVDTASSGDQFTVIGQFFLADWVQICCFNGQSGWLFANSVTENANGTATVKVDLLNIRSGPSILQPSIGQVNTGDIYQITGRFSPGGWWQLCCFDGAEAWVSMTAADPNGNTTGIPVLTAAEVSQIPLSSD